MRSELARFGFFYLGNADRSQCFSCGGVLRNWTAGDDIEAVHRDFMRSCKCVESVLQIVFLQLAIGVEVTRACCALIEPPV